jgi:hypothetical protein
MRAFARPGSQPIPGLYGPSSELLSGIGRTPQKGRDAIFAAIDAPLIGLPIAFWRY